MDGKSLKETRGQLRCFPHLSFLHPFSAFEIERSNLVEDGLSSRFLNSLEDSLAKSVLMTPGTVDDD